MKRHKIVMYIISGFLVMTMLVNISVIANAADYTVVNGVLVKYTGSGTIVDLSGNYGITKIGSSAFKDCWKITKIVLPSSITVIYKIQNIQRVL